MSDQRHILRVPATLVCKFEENGEIQEGIIINFSPQGVGTTSNVSLEPETEKDLLFSPGNMQVPATVVWCSEETSGYTIGWHFEKEVPEIIVIIRQLENFWKTLQQQK